MAYALLALGFVVLAVLVTAVLLVPVTLLRRAVQPKPAPAEPHLGDPPAPNAAARTVPVEPEQPRWMRCQDCKCRWLAVPGDDVTALGRAARRLVRRGSRALGGTGRQARYRGWTACPACSSTNLSVSRQQGASTAR